jgi:hypothetical protein
MMGRINDGSFIIRLPVASDASDIHGAANCGALTDN